VGKQVVGRLLPANPFQPIKLSTQSETGSSEPILSSRALESCVFWRSHLRVDSPDWTGEPHPRFPVQGHILSIGGDALKQSFNVALALGIQTLAKTFIHTLITYLVTHTNQLWPQKKQEKTSVPNKFCFHYLYFPNLISNPRKESPP
jgi:hypothetical protein